MISNKDYHPFGMPQPGRTFNAGEYRYSFNGMENDGKDWTSTESSHLDYGARIYDSRLGRMLSTDPAENKFAGHSPYNGFFNNPPNVIDPDGKTSIAVIQGDKVIVSSNYYFYGCDIDNETAAGIANEIEDAWNDANGEVTINGKTYPVVYEIKGYAISDPEVARAKMKDSKFEDNFIGLGEGKNTSMTAGNTGYYNMDQDQKTGGTTFPHEKIHGDGQEGHPDVDDNGNIKVDVDSEIPIRIPSDAKIDNVFIDPSKRKVTQSDIDATNIPNAIKNNNGKLGTTSNNNIFNEDGSRNNSTEQQKIIEDGMKMLEKIINEKKSKSGG